MTSFLLLVALGPIQDFIAQARRTRDLWYGSHLLSEISRCAARSMVEQGAVLVFPALATGDSELNICLAPLRPESGKPPISIANKLLAEIPDGIEPKAVARAVRENVQTFWRTRMAEPVKVKSGGLLAPGIDAVWKEQVETLLEFAAAWAPLAGKEDYASARQQLEQAVAARKNLRDFRAWEQLRGNVPKSSLDGGRETVLCPPKQRHPALAHRYRIGDGEQLDAVGLVKRAGGEPEQFVPIVNVALASWFELATQNCLPALERLKKECAALKLARVDRPDLPCAQAFPFDASVALESRWKPLFEEQGLSGNPEHWGRKHVQPLLRQLTEPTPYVACLVADGDHMGRALDALSNADAHRAFSRALAGFAGKARAIVEQEHRGSLAYAGGDDVLAFLPLPEALACAQKLRIAFRTIMDPVCSALDARMRPTLSVGLGLGHVMEGMGDLLELGREAERLAKGAAFRSLGQDRNALAVIVDKRSGGQRSWRARWNDWGDDPVERLRLDGTALEEQLSSRKVYEVERVLDRLPPPDDAKEGDWSLVLAMEVRRSLSRVHAGGMSLEPVSLGLRLDAGMPYGELRGEVKSWVDRLLIARTFDSATPRLKPSGKEDAA